jgi:hypothetical protein
MLPGLPLMSTTSARSILRANLMRTVLVFGSALLIALGAVFVIDLWRPRRAPASTLAIPLGMATPFGWPGIETPLTFAANQATLRDNDEVIGVCVNSAARAYLVSAFAGPQHHVVNDLLSRQPISVTHCDLENCTRVFTGAENDKPLKLACGGSLNGALLLSAPGGTYVQETSASLNPDAPGLAYDRFPFVITTWGDWRRGHPDTDVYVGGESEPLHSPPHL